MDDPFHNPASSNEAALSRLWKPIFSVPPALLITFVLAPLLLVVVTRILSARTSDGDNADEETSGTQSYWFSNVSRGVSILRNEHGNARNRGEELFTIDLGSIPEDKASKSDAVASENVQKTPPKINYTTWHAASKFFGLSSKPKYGKVLEQLLYIQKRHLSETLVAPVIQNLERNIPQMISFIDSSIDLQPWERLSSPILLSPTTIEIDLFSLIQNMLGYASIPVVFGRGLLEKYPFLLQDVQTMDDGMIFFLLGLPAVTPWSGVFTAHMARRRVWEAMDGQQKVLDRLARGDNDDDEEWGDLEDASELVLERNRLWRENDFTIKERGDIGLLYALTVTPTHLTYHLTLAILSTSSLLTRILTEIKPHLQLTEGLAIGKHSSPPSLAISSEGLTRNCPLLRSTYLETLRVLKTGRGKDESFRLDRFRADRFVDVESENRQSAGFVEKECLALVAGVLAMWEFEPVEGEVWGRFEMGAMLKDGERQRVRVKRKKLEWDV